MVSLPSRLGRGFPLAASCALTAGWDSDRAGRLEGQRASPGGLAHVDTWLGLRATEGFCRAGWLESGWCKQGWGPRV